MDLDTFTTWLHGEIHKTLARDPHCKHYEGEMSLLISDVFTRPRKVAMVLNMYVIAPDGRQHEWRGETVAECCGMAHADISRWIAEGEAEG